MKLLLVLLTMSFPWWENLPSPIQGRLPFSRNTWVFMALPSTEGLLNSYLWDTCNQPVLPSTRFLSSLANGQNVRPAHSPLALVISLPTLMPKELWAPSPLINFLLLPSLYNLYLSPLQLHSMLRFLSSIIMSSVGPSLNLLRLNELQVIPVRIPLFLCILPAEMPSFSLILQSISRSWENPNVSFRWQFLTQSG